MRAFIRNDRAPVSVYARITNVCTNRKNKALGMIRSSFIA